MAELVAKTSEDVAVDDSLTTLIDWVNIEQVSGFTIIVENAGGGSANDITDVQIDTSDDGGATSNLDQHAGVPAVPIADGQSKTGTFSQTAAWIRVRAICATGDTTANAVLIASSSTARICTLSDVKERLGLADTDFDQTINRVILGIEAVFNARCNRHLILNSSDATEYYTAQGKYIKLARYPVVAVTSVKIAYDFDFDSATALTANTDYRLARGGVDGTLRRLATDWPTEEDVTQVVYRGGYCAAGQAAGDGETALPADLREAAIEQASFIFKRRDDIGLSGVGYEGGSINKFSAMKLLPMVEEILQRYRRIPL